MTDPCCPLPRLDGSNLYTVALLQYIAPESITHLDDPDFDNKGQPNFLDGIDVYR